MCEVKSRNFPLSLKLDVAKPKRLIVKQEDPEDSFYDTNIDDEKGLDSAIELFTLPTPDLMKKFPGINLQINRTAPNTPTVEEREFEQTSLSLMPDVSNLEDNNLDFIQRTPQLNALSGSLQTPVVDPNFTRNPLVGHLIGLAPPVSHESFDCAQTTQPVNPRTSAASTFTTHYSIVSPSYNTDESCSALSSSTSSFVAPSTSQQQYSDSYNPASFHELRTRDGNVPQQQEQSTDSLPTVIPDHVYSYSPASVASPASVLSHDSTSSDTYSRISPNSGTKRKQSDDSTVSKKPRMTKKQQFVELQNREKYLYENNAELRRRVEGMTEGCKKLKELLMQKLQNAP